jgi:uncharacterized protein (TIGR02145 family)
LSSSNQPGHGSFILQQDNTNDWRNPQNNNLWQGVNGVNNPCPIGYRVPTITEWQQETNSFISQNSAGAFASQLKLTMTGRRNSSSGTLLVVGSNGFYWSSSNSPGGGQSEEVQIDNSIDIVNNSRARGISVRCIKN